MTRYTTPAAVRLALDPSWAPGVTEVDGPAQSAAELSDEQILDAIDQASARVDSYLAARYTTPVAAVDPNASPLTFPDVQVSNLTRDLACYYATLTYYRGQTVDPNEPVALRYAAAMLDLTGVRDGKLTLNLPGPDPSSDASQQGGFAGVADPGTGGLFDDYDIGARPGGISPVGLLSTLPWRQDWPGW